MELVVTGWAEGYDTTDWGYLRTFIHCGLCYYIYHLFYTQQYTSGERAGINFPHATLYNNLQREMDRNLDTLTTSQDPVEIERARKLKTIAGFLFKPLDPEGLKRIYTVLKLEQ